MPLPVIVAQHRRDLPALIAAYRALFVDNHARVRVEFADGADAVEFTHADRAALTAKVMYSM